MTRTAARMLSDPPQAVEPKGGLAPVVFLGLPMAINVRDVLRTDAFRTLKDADVEIHLFSAAADVAEFRAEFAGPRVHIHRLAAPRSRLFELWDTAVLKLHVLLLSL